MSLQNTISVLTSKVYTTVSGYFYRLFGIINGTNNQRLGYNVYNSKNGKFTIVHNYGRNNYIYSNENGTNLQFTDTAATGTLARAGVLNYDGTYAAATLSFETSGNSSGNVKVYSRSGNTWTTQTTIIPNANSNLYGFGSTLAMNNNGDVLAIGVYTDAQSSGKGQVKIYNRSGNTWTNTANLSDPSNNTTSRFATFSNKIAFNSSGNRLIVGAEGTAGFIAPNAYIFTNNGVSWSNITLSPSDPNANGTTHSAFGQSCDMTPNGNTVIIGAPFTNYGNIANAGACYIFNFDGNTWNESFKIFANTPSANAYFGSCVSISGSNLFIVSAPYNNNSAISTVHVFKNNYSNTYTEIQTLMGTSNANGYGTSSSYTDDAKLITVGAFNQLPLLTQGAWYKYIT